MINLKAFNQKELEALDNACTIAWRGLSGNPMGDTETDLAIALADLKKAGFTIEDQYDAQEAQEALDAEIKNRKEPVKEAKPAYGFWFEPDGDRVRVMIDGMTVKVWLTAKANGRWDVKFTGVDYDQPGRWGFPYFINSNQKPIDGAFDVAARAIEEIIGDPRSVMFAQIMDEARE